MKRNTVIRAAAVAVVAGLVLFTFTGCASVVWNSAFYETAFESDAVKLVEGVGAKEVAKYTTVLWFPLGIETYQGLISAELRKGKRAYHKVVKNYYFFSETIGYIEVLE